MESSLVGRKVDEMDTRSVGRMESSLVGRKVDEMDWRSVGMMAI